MAYGKEKMDEIRRRIEQIRVMKGFSKNSMAKAIGLKYTGGFCAQTVEGSPHNLSHGTLKLICSTLGVNWDWLIDGVGDMFAAPPVEKLMQSFDSAFNVNGNNSSNVTQRISADYKSLEVMNKMLIKQVKEKDEEIARLNKRLDKLIELLK